jgi:hypothetical protein
MSSSGDGRLEDEVEMAGLSAAPVSAAPLPLQVASGSSSRTGPKEQVVWRRLITGTQRRDKRGRPHTPQFSRKQKNCSKNLPISLIHFSGGGGEVPGVLSWRAGMQLPSSHRFSSCSGSITDHPSSAVYNIHIVISDHCSPCYSVPNEFIDVTLSQKNTAPRPLQLHRHRGVTRALLQT